MYFLNEEEKRLLLRSLLPRSRESEIHRDLRGWNWHQPPLSPIYEVKLGVYEIAGKYCPTGRDVYLRRVEGRRVGPNVPMIEGSTLHQALTSIILAAKRTIYNEGAACLECLASLQEPDLALVEDQPLPPEEREALQKKVSLLWEFEYHRIMARVQEILAKQPQVGPDSLVALALPLTVEQKLDGAFLGLSSHLSADASLFSEPMMLDVKFGRKEGFHRLTTTGYALVMESIYEFPINVGCVVYATFRDDRLLIDRDFHLIDDELRQWFIDERDERMRMIEEEIDPGRAEECYGGCPFSDACVAA
jgi:CRISPR-associated protein Csa1